MLLFVVAAVIAAAVVIVIIIIDAATAPDVCADVGVDSFLLSLLRMISFFLLNLLAVAITAAIADDDIAVVDVVF